MIELSPIERIAKILRTDKHHLTVLEKRMTEVTGKKGVFEKIAEENKNLMRDRMAALGVSIAPSANEIYEAIIAKIDLDDHRISDILGKPICHKKEDCSNVAESALRISGNPRGFFLKTKKAREFSLKEPPRDTMKFLGYDSVEKMLAVEDLFEVYASLRFIEGSDWLNNKFFKQYETLTAGDFEVREVRVMALDYKWGKTAEGFVVKKKHNISHLKELGVVFILPVMLGIPGEILRMFALIMHYLNEIPFYSDIARKISSDKDFAAKYVSLLRGDVIENETSPAGGKTLWLVVQRYLSKDDENDWRLFVPHINPEAMHWEKAEMSLSKLGEGVDDSTSLTTSNFSKELSFWHGLNWVGDYFKDESGVEVLASFNLVDAVMSLVKEKEMVKYLYHHQESLWNKIFLEYMGEGGLEKYSRDNLLKGYFEI